MDILLIALADVTRDARTLNAARVLARAGYRVGVLASGTDVSEPNLQHVPWHDPGGRAWRRRRALTRAARAVDARPRVVAAMDFFALQAAFSVARRCNARVVYDAREFYFALGPLAGHPVRQRVLAWIERRAIRRVHAVTVSGPLDADVLAQRYALAERPAVILNTPPYADRVTSDLLRRHGDIPSGDLVLLYQGVVHHGRGIEPVMTAMAERSDVHLCVIGDGPARAALEQRAAALGVDGRVHWIGSIPYDELHAWTCSADIGLTLIEDVSMSYAYALPNKFFEYMRARVPQLVSDLPALHAMVQEHPVGILVDAALAPQDVTRGIDRLRNPATRQAFAEQCDDIRDLCYERQARVLLDVYASMMER